MFFNEKNIDLIHFLDPIQYEFWFFIYYFSWPGAGAKTSIYRLRPKVSAPCGSGSTTLEQAHRRLKDAPRNSLAGSVADLYPYDFGLLDPDPAT